MVLANKDAHEPPIPTQKHQRKSFQVNGDGLTLHLTDAFWRDN